MRSFSFLKQVQQSLTSRTLKRYKCLCVCCYSDLVSQIQVNLNSWYEIASSALYLLNYLKHSVTFREPRSGCLKLLTLTSLDLAEKIIAFLSFPTHMHMSSLVLPYKCLSNLLLWHACIRHLSKPSGPQFADPLDHGTVTVRCQ